MSIIFGVVMALAIPDPTFEQATICSALTAGLKEGMATKANRAGATDDDRNNLRLTVELHARASARALALIETNPLDSTELQLVRKRVTDTVRKASADPWQKLGECAALFAVK